MHVRDCAVGIDIGTTSVKAIVVSRLGELLYERSIPHDLESPHPGYAEEDPETWWNSSVELLRDITARVETGRIAALGFSGMVPTVVLVGKDGCAQT